MLIIFFILAKTHIQGEITDSICDLISSGKVIKILYPTEQFWAIWFQNELVKVSPTTLTQVFFYLWHNLKFYIYNWRHLGVDFHFPVQKVQLQTVEYATLKIKTGHKYSISEGETTERPYR